MNKIAFFVCAFCWPVFLMSQQANIIPQPVSVKELPGSFTIDAGSNLTIGSSTEELTPLANYFQSYIKKNYGIELPVNGNQGKSIQLIIKKVRSAGDEVYLLEVSTKGIRIIAPSKAGVLYGMQSLFFLFKAPDK